MTKPRFKIVGPWTPQLWPRRGEEVLVPINHATAQVGTIIETEEGSHVVGSFVTNRGVEKFKGRPVTIVDLWSADLSPTGVWLWEEYPG